MLKNIHSGSLLRLVFISVSLATLYSTASAQSVISLNFPGGGDGTYGSSGQNSSLSPDLSPGYIPAANWNNADHDAANNKGGLSLEDNTGAASGVLATWTSAGTWDKNSSLATDNDFIYDGWLSGMGPGKEAIVNFTNLNAFTGGSPYDVYVYVGNEDSGNKFKREAAYRLSDATTGKAEFYLGIGNSDPNDGFTLATQTNPSGGSKARIAEYVLFAGVSGDSFTLTGVGVDAAHKTGLRAPIAGIQIVTGEELILARSQEKETLPDDDIDTIPEPSCFAFLGLALATSVIARRRTTAAGD